MYSASFFSFLFSYFLREARQQRLSKLMKQMHLHHIKTWCLSHFVFIVFILCTRKFKRCYCQTYVDTLSLTLEVTFAGSSTIQCYICYEQSCPKPWNPANIEKILSSSGWCLVNISYSYLILLFDIPS